MPSKIIATCAICGIRRTARYSRGYLCGTCRPMLAKTPDPNDGLPPGRWYTGKGGVAVWRPLDPDRIREHQEQTIIKILAKRRRKKAA